MGPQNPGESQKYNFFGRIIARSKITFTQILAYVSESWCHVRHDGANVSKTLMVSTKNWRHIWQLVQTVLWGSIQLYSSSFSQSKAWISYSHICFLLEETKMEQQDKSTLSFQTFHCSCMPVVHDWSFWQSSHLWTIIRVRLYKTLWMAAPSNKR